MVREVRSESKPTDEIKMDQYGEAAKAYIRARTGATSAAFFAGYDPAGLRLW